MTLQEFAHEIPALKDEAKQAFGDNYMPHLFAMLLDSVDAVAHLKANTPEKEQ